MVNFEKILRWETLALLIVIIFMAVVYTMNPSRYVMRRLHSLGYIGIFLLMFLSSATILLPVPGLVGVPVAAVFLNPILVGIFGGIGSALGELTGYFAGCGGRVAIEKNKSSMYKKTKKWMKKNGVVTIFVMAAIPNPFFDIAGIAAGALEYPLWEFLLACLAGEILKCVVLAYLGHSLL